MSVCESTCFNPLGKGPKFQRKSLTPFRINHILLTEEFIVGFATELLQFLVHTFDFCNKAVLQGEAFQPPPKMNCFVELRSSKTKTNRSSTKTHQD